MYQDLSDPLASDAPVIVYTDYKSPYAFLAKDPLYALEDKYGVEFDWRPLTLDIPSYLGTAKAGEGGEVLEGNRSPRQWAWVKYAYHDAKRYASLRGLTLLGPRQIWDSSPASIGMLWVRSQPREIFRKYTDLAFERFFKRELTIDDPNAIEQLIREAGGDAEGFQDYHAGEGRVLHDELQPKLHPAGFYGVPSFVVGGEIYFGREHLPMVEWHLAGGKGEAPDIAYEVPAA